MSFQLSPTHIRFDGISKSFPDRRVLTDISLTASAGEVIGVIGENGSGKSTLLRIAAGLLPADSGTVTVDGTPVTPWSTSRCGATDSTSGPLRTDLARNTAASRSEAAVPGVEHRGPRIGLLHQEAPFAPEETVRQAIERAVAPIRLAEAQLEHAATVLESTSRAEASSGRSHLRALQEAQTTYGTALEKAERLEVWSLDAQIAETIDAFGLASIPPGRLTAELSGGERARLSLAWLLLSHPDVLLLDEPTNHLDDTAVAFLRSRLSDWSGPVIFASHDRAFLDETADVLVDLDPAPRPHSLVRAASEEGPTTGMGATRFGGTYSEYLLHRRAQRERWERQFREEQAELKRLRAGMRDSYRVGHPGREPRTEGGMAQKFYADRNAKVVSRRVSEAQRRLEELESSQVAKPPAELQFRGFSGTDRVTASSVVVSAADIEVTGRLAPTSFAVSEGEHLLITGPNGSGKSTLLKLVVGSLQPTGGSVSLVGTDRESVGMLGQEVTLGRPDEGTRANRSRTVIEVYNKSVGVALAEEVPLSTFGLLNPRDFNRPVSALSVGQQRRLELAVLLAHPPQLLLLDEPTNHLSLSLVGALEKEIPSYPGTVIVASHDRWLRETWTGRTLELGK